MKLRFVSKLVAAGMLSLAIGTLGVQVARAQRPVFLLEQQCVNVGGGYWGGIDKVIHVGGQLYQSVMQMYPVSYDRPATMVCRTTPFGEAPRFQTLNLEFGKASSAAGSPVVVTVWLDGNQVASQAVAAGEVKSLVVNVAQARNIALQTSCLNSENCSQDMAWFFKAQLEPTAASPSNSR